MTTNTTSQTQHATRTTEASAALPGVELWRTMMEGHAERLEKVFAEVERLECERIERTVSAIDDMAKLMKSSLDYHRELAVQWRKLGLDAAKKSAELAGTF